LLQELRNERLINTYNETRNGDLLMETTEKAYTTKEVSTTLEVGDSTLKKWCLSLEKNGYKFLRNNKNQRLFVESDLVVLRNFQQLVQKNNVPLESAAKLIVDRFGNGPFEGRTGIVRKEEKEDHRDSKRYEEVIQQLSDHIEKQEKFNQELLKRLEQQQKYIEERLNERDKMLVASLRDSLKEAQETRKLLVATQEKQKKSFWKRLFVYGQRKKIDDHYFGM
jgi:DNA-binding transcriptional MerR regulator